MVTMSVEEAVTRVIRKARILESPGGKRISIVISAERKRHIKRDCLYQKKNKANENQGSSKFANAVEDNSDNADGDMFSIASNSEHHMDSGFNMFVSHDVQHKLV
jgi:hypothetical protein